MEKALDAVRKQSFQCFEKLFEVPAWSVLLPPTRDWSMPVPQALNHDGTRHITKPILGEVVINVGGASVPFGTRGIIVTVHNESKCIEVIWENSVMGAHSLAGMCSNGRGTLVAWTKVISLTRPVVCDVDPQQNQRDPLLDSNADARTRSDLKNASRTKPNSSPVCGVDLEPVQHDSALLASNQHARNTTNLKNILGIKPSSSGRSVVCNIDAQQDQAPALLDSNQHARSAADLKNTLGINKTKSSGRADAAALLAKIRGSVAVAPSSKTVSKGK
jgi:hypothetical protein